MNAPSQKVVTRERARTTRRDSRFGWGLLAAHWLGLGLGADLQSRSRGRSVNVGSHFIPPHLSLVHAS